MHCTCGQTCFIIRKNNHNYILHLVVLHGAKLQKDYWVSFPKATWKACGSFGFPRPGFPVGNPCWKMAFWQCFWVSWKASNFAPSCHFDLGSSPDTVETCARRLHVFQHSIELLQSGNLGSKMSSELVGLLMLQVLNLSTRNVFELRRTKCPMNHGSLAGLFGILPDMISLTKKEAFATYF